MDGAIVQSGDMSCFYYKQLAQAAVRRALGCLPMDDRVDDRIDVRDRPPVGQASRLSYSDWTSGTLVLRSPFSFSSSAWMAASVSA